MQTLAQRRMLADRMEELVQALPALRRRADTAVSTGLAATSLLQGSNDAVAGAALQGRVQDMAQRAGASLSSVETLPAAPAGAYRRIGLHVSLVATWPVLVGLLQSVEQARPRMLVDDLQLHGSHILLRSTALPLTASFTVYAFRGTEHRQAHP